MQATEDRSRQTLRHALGEFRAGFELAGLALSARWVLENSPLGDGHTVVVFPPWFGSSGTIAPLRSMLDAAGYRAVEWGLGRNLGLRQGLTERLLERVDRLSSGAGRPVSLVGWSAGGVMAREVARLVPEAVRCVVTLGSPFQMDVRETWMAPLFKRLSGAGYDQIVNDESAARLAMPLPVPSSALLTISDGVCPPAWCRERPAPRAENIVVPGSHCGLGISAPATFVVLDRLAEPPGSWRPFRLSGGRSRFFRRGSFAH